MLYAIVAVLILIADQGMKYWTTLHLELNTGVKELIPGLIHLRNIHNYGSAFSFLQNWESARWLFLAVTVAFAALVIFAIAKKMIDGPIGRWTALCILAGALGNGIDRAFYGYVVDMVQFGFWESFPVFNVADVFITVGGIVFCLYIILSKDPIHAPDKQAARKGPGGSVTTRAPRRVAEKPAVPAKEKAAAPRRFEKPAAAPKEKSAPAPERKAPAAGKRVAAQDKKMPAPEKKAAAPAPVRKPAAVQREEAPLPPRTARQRRTVKADDTSGLEQIKRPVVTHESFLEMTKRKPGSDPFAEWMQAASAPAAESAPAQETKAAPAAEMPAAPAVPVREVMPEPPVVEAAPAPKPEPAPEPVQTADERVNEPELSDEMVFSLEDILNEFRDL